MLLMSSDFRIVEFVSGKFHPKDLAKFCFLGFSDSKCIFLPSSALGSRTKGKRKAGSKIRWRRSSTPCCHCYYGFGKGQDSAQKTQAWIESETIVASDHCGLFGYYGYYEKGTRRCPKDKGKKCNILASALQWVQLTDEKAHSSESETIAITMRS